MAFELLVGLARGLAPTRGLAPSLPWDKPAAVPWEAHADSLASTSNHAQHGQYLAHPASSLRWATFDEDEDGTIRSWRFVNSAQRAVSLPVDWYSVFQAALRLESDASTNPVSVGVVSDRRGSSMPALATLADLEKALAAALVCRPVLATEISHARGVRCPRPPPLEPPEGLRLGQLQRTRVGASLFADASVVSLSRDTMPLCWPKAFHFAKMLHYGDEDASRRLGSIPVAWGIDARRWEAQHRHRVLGGLLAAKDVLLVLDETQDLGGGATWRLPSKSRMRLARHAADLLAAFSETETDAQADDDRVAGVAVCHAADAAAAADAAYFSLRGPPREPPPTKLVARAREALRKAPDECDEIGISEGLREVIARRALQPGTASQRGSKSAARGAGGATCDAADGSAHDVTRRFPSAAVHLAPKTGRYTSRVAPSHGVSRGTCVA